MKMLKIVISLLVIYFLICIKYYFRYNFPEIVQIPNGLEKKISSIIMMITLET